MAAWPIRARAGGDLRSSVLVEAAAAQVKPWRAMLGESLAQA